MIEMSAGNALPTGASCGASCQHIARCRETHALKGSENMCVHEPSQFTPNPLRGNHYAPLREPQFRHEVEAAR
jgi:hypothetical protein